MRKKQSRAGIERRILTSILWVSVVPMALALVIGYTFAYEATRRAVQQELTSAAKKSAEGLGLVLNAQRRHLASLSQDSQVVAALEPHKVAGSVGQGALEARLQAESENAADGAALVSLYDAQGNLVASSHPTSKTPQRLTERERAIDGPSSVDFPYLPEKFESTVRVVAPVHEPATGALIGFVSKVEGVASLLEFAFTWRVWGSEGHPQGVYQVAYEAADGFHISQRDAPSHGKSPRVVFETVDSRLAEQFREPGSGNGGFLHLPKYKGQHGAVDVYLGYQPLPGIKNVYVVVYRSIFGVYAELHLGLMLAFAGSALVIPFFILVAYRNVHNNIARPIALLNEGAQIIRQGDLDLKLKIGTGDEIEELASSFNKMALALKRNIRQLEDSEEKYRGLINSMRDGVCQADPDGTITFMNPAGLEILGYEDVEDAAGRNLRDLFLKQADHDFIVVKLAELNFVERRRLWLKRRDGRAICVEFSVNRVFDDEDKFIGEEGIFRDMTESLRLEQEARERSEHIQVINQIANAINSSLEAGRLYESIAAEMKKLVDFDYASLALVNEPGDAFETRQLWPEHDTREAVSEQPAQGGSCAAWVARARAPLRVEDLQKGGAQFASDFPNGVRSCLCVPLYAAERIIGSLNLGSNQAAGFSAHHEEVLTELALHVAVAIRNAQLVENLQASLEEVTRAREKLYEANEELKTLDETKTNLLSNVSHELRTPLVSVMGYTDMILHEKAGPLTDAQREYLNISLRNVEKLVTLIENLLDFSRLHRGTEELMFDTLDLTDCVRTSMEIIKPVADGRSIRFELIAPEEPLFVEGDKGKLGQVFNNLLSNAVKFNHNGGAVTITLKPEAESVAVSVADTGIGIPSDALDKIFTRFYQVDGSSTRKYGGTGIGLAIAQDIIRLHGNRITVTSELGEGSTFRFAVPLARVRKEEEEGAAALPRTPETHFLIELITSDRALSTQVANLLSPEGMNLVCASHVANAISLAQKHRPDCIVVDVEENGRQQDPLKELLASDVANDTPIVLVTNDNTVCERYRTRVSWRIGRGFHKSDLLRGIHYAIGQGIAKRETAGAKVLCVDDDSEILTFMQRCLEVEGCDVECCSTGEEAVALVKERHHGIVLLDVAMPGIDGWETCRRIKSDASLAGVRVFLVTAKPVDSSLPRVRGCGADGYLLKPFKAEDLLGLVQGFAAGRTAQET